jgi:SAM-dependent methyltransferase
LTPLPANPVRKSIVGIGMTDSECYAGKLEKKFSYRNTYLHKEPKLNILNLDNSDDGLADFIICSDVLEHVAPPVHLAFHNLFRLLKRDGVLVLTVPLVEKALAKEHFPGLGEYHFELRGDRRVLVNRTASDTYEEFSELVFHGGEGETLEMRLFSKEWLLEELKNAGFTRVRVIDEEYPNFGILWRQDKSVPLVAWK